MALPLVDKPVVDLDQVERALLHKLMLDVLLHKVGGMITCVWEKNQGMDDSRRLSVGTANPPIPRIWTFICSKLLINLRMQIRLPSCSKHPSINTHRRVRVTNVVLPPGVEHVKRCHGQLALSLLLAELLLQLSQLVGVPN